MTTVLSTLQASELGFGCMGITAFYGPAMADSEALSLLEAVYSNGVRHFDTAEVYQQFEAVVPNSSKYNEEVLGKFLQSKEAGSYTVATKFFPGLHNGACDAETVSTAVSDSLTRLGVPQIDLYYLHRMPSSIDLLEEWMRAMKDVVQSGRVKYVGLSEAPPEWLRRAHAIHPVACVQQEWSLLTREPVESSLVPVCKELGVSIVAYSPLARNLLALGKDDLAPCDWRSAQPRYADQENFEKNKELASKVAALAGGLGLTGAQLSLAWLHQRAKEMGVACVAIPGTTKVQHALDNIAALQCRQLTDSEMAQLAELGANVAGARGNADYISMAFEGKSQLA